MRGRRTAWMTGAGCVAAGTLAGVVFVTRRRGRREPGSSPGHTHPTPCPYRLRCFLNLPRPWLTIDRLVRILEARPGEKLLEIGPGTGRYTLPVARALEPSGTIDAFDAQQEMLDALMGHAVEWGLSNVRPERGDAPQLPYEDDAFDGAYLVTALHEIPDQDAALRELRRVVKPGGRVVVGEMAPLPTTHFVRFADFVRRAEEAGFELEQRRGPALAFYARLRAAR